MNQDETIPYEPRRPAVMSPSAPLPPSAGVGPGDQLPANALRDVPPPPPPAKAPQAVDGEAPARSPDSFGTGELDRGLEFKIIEAIQTVYDPEIPVNIYDMGMIYEIRVDVAGSAYVRMTLTSPSCPVAGSLPGEVEQKVKSVEGVTEAHVELVWEPSWSMDLLSDAARLELNL